MDLYHFWFNTNTGPFHVILRPRFIFDHAMINSKGNHSDNQGEEV